MNKLLLPHHSVSDWDFSPATSYVLDNGIYVSPPSSLKIQYGGGVTVEKSVLCRIDAVQCVPEGEIRSWFRSDLSYCGNNFLFRNQAPLGSANYNNCYLWSIRKLMARLYRVINGTGSEKYQCAIDYPADEWTHWRTVFWNGENEQGQNALAVQLFKEVEGQWVQQGDTYFDTDQLWKNSATNRMGIGAYNKSGAVYYFDDTELWIPQA